MSQASAGAATERSAQFDRAMIRLLPRLRRKALGLTQDRSGADDLLQETLLRALRFWPSFRGGTNLLAWLTRIMFNAFVNVQRRERLAAHALRRLSPATPSPNGAEAELHRRVFSSLDDRLARRWSRLPQRDRALLRLIHNDELSYEDTARTLAWPVGTVMSRVHRARRALGAGAIAPVRG